MRVRRLGPVLIASVALGPTWLAASIVPARGDSASITPSTSAGAPTTWMLPGDIPLPEWALSAEVLRDDEALSIAPGGSRRGLVAAGVRLPIFGATRGPGCISRWLLVGPLAYVCSDKVRFSADAPAVAPSLQPPADGGLPYRYYFVGADGADAFGKLADVDDETPLEQLDKGWAVAGVAEVSFRGRTFVQTRRGRFIARSQLGAVAANGFHGEPLDVAPGAELGIGWVLPDKATLYSAEKTGSKSLGARTRLQRVKVVETRKGGKDVWHRVESEGVEGWMRGADLRVPTPTALPEGVREGERWIDVDVTTQSLVAYEGARPVFATVVSTGRPGPGTATPKGTFKVWVKLRTSTMSNADDAPSDSTEEGATYSIEDVPWVQYFSNGVALHGAFWHRRFGFAHSHGCVNLAPLDALRLFDWTLPRVPAGWDATFPTPAEPPTVVKVR